MADYSIISLGAGVMVVTDNAPVPTDGTVVLDGSFTSLQFADQTVTEAASLGPSMLTKVVGAPAAILTADLGAINYLVGEGKVSVAAISITGAVAGQAFSDEATGHAVCPRSNRRTRFRPDRDGDRIALASPERVAVEPGRRH